MNKYHVRIFQDATDPETYVFSDRCNLAEAMRRAEFAVSSGFAVAEIVEHRPGYELVPLMQYAKGVNEPVRLWETAAPEPLALAR
ncbi:MAG TPA: hypothetical protein VK524_01605 [Polyangiaceae bacterium]|nr:hypothetical protein [Polyangiaceae bacterium]